MRAPSCELWRTFAKSGELWRTHNTIFTSTSVTFTRVPAKVPHIHQSSGEGAFCMCVAFRMCPSNESHSPLPNISTLFVVKWWKFFFLSPTLWRGFALKFPLKFPSRPLEIPPSISVKVRYFSFRQDTKKGFHHLTPKLWAFSFSPRKSPPKSPKWDPKKEFPGITRTKGFCGNSTANLDFPEFPGPSRFRI